jgi:hypothetical protein
MTRAFTLFVLAAALAGFAQSALASPITYVAILDGPSESPANASPGTGFAQVDIDIVAHQMRVQATFQDLLGITTASHIHAATALPGTGTAGVATQTPSFIGFPLGVTSGFFDQTFDTSLASTYRAAYITANGGTPAGAEAALAASMAAGTAYFNIHTNLFPAGEIRGFLVQPVPEPASLSLLALGGLGLLFSKRRKS